MIIVLRSAETGCWKIADFGTCCAATSKNMHTTPFARGTPSYRAPEVLAEEGKYNNKADVWSLGCVIYEIFTGKRAFSSDWAVMEYGSNNESLALPNIWRPEFLRPLQGLLTAIFARTPLLRPSAKSILPVLSEMAATPPESNLSERPEISRGRSNTVRLEKPRRRILSLDGGGIRGLTLLLVIKEIMDEVSR